MKRPRILHIITRLGAGGSARHVIEVSSRLREEFDVHIAAGVEDEGEGSLRPEAAAAGIPVSPLPSLRRRGSLLSDRRALRELVDRVRSLEPSLVHTHQSKAGVLGRMAARKAGVRRTVHTFHSPLERLGQDGLLRRANVTAEQRLARDTDRLVAVSPSLRDELVRQEVVAADRIEVILPLVDPRRLFEARQPGALKKRLGLPLDVPLVGLVGRLAPPKDPETFMKVFATVAASVPEVRAVVVGDGPDRSNLEADAVRRGLRPRITFTGWAADVSDVYPDLDLLVLTSRYEGFGLSALEAMAAGRPVVATRVTGIVDLVGDGRTGLLAPAGDAAALAGAVILLLRDPAFRSRLGAAAREEAARRFSSEDACPRIEALYRRLLNLPVHRPARAGAPSRTAIP